MLRVKWRESAIMKLTTPKAIKWYRKAANLGYAVAQFNLGVMYDCGKGVPQDFEKAYVW